jgi:hypothetical protein
MKLLYRGESFGVAGLTDGKEYVCLGVEGGGDFGPMLRVVDDDEDDWNYDSRPDWLPGYLYSPVNPGPLDGNLRGGVWEVVEDDEYGTLAKVIGDL